MNIKIKCPGCGHWFEVPEVMAGATMRCSSCHGRAKVPSRLGPDPKSVAGEENIDGLQWSPIGTGRYVPPQAKKRTKGLHPGVIVAIVIAVAGLLFLFATVAIVLLVKFSGSTASGNLIRPTLQCRYSA
jgi:hypothetical protein